MGADRLLLKQISVGPMANFVYLLVDEGSLEALVVDSGWETGPILESARSFGARVKFAVASHEHFDHTATLRDLAVSMRAKLVAHQDSPIDCDVRVGEGAELELGTRKVRVLHTPGHTKDSICLYDGQSLFTGDTLFIGNIGRFEVQMSEVMYKSLKTILALPEDTVIYPGHDYGEVGSRTLGEEKRANPFLRAKDFKDFLSTFA